MTLQSNSIQCPLVGAHFRPPAKQVLASLPAGCQLKLRAEPDNPYDPKAIGVWVSPDQIPLSQHEALGAALDGTGVGLGDVLAEPEVHLGYLPDSDGKVCQRDGVLGNRQVAGQAQALGRGVEELEATLTFGLDGKPWVLVRF